MAIALPGLALPGGVGATPRTMAMTARNMPAIPPLGPDGRFRTINSGLDGAQRLWHVRAALNVAALGCKGDGQKPLIDAYNRFITANRTVLATADRSVRARFQGEFGGGWQMRHDAYQTSLYNFFAQPFVQSAFCAAAAPIAQAAGGVRPVGVAAFADDALPRLEAPFLDYYRRYAAYEVALADYERRLASGVEERAAPPPASPLLDYGMDRMSGWAPAPAPAPRIGYDLRR